MKKGFTLIELLVVIAIIGILSSVVLASLNEARKNARVAQAQASLQSTLAAATICLDRNEDLNEPAKGSTIAVCDDSSSDWPTLPETGNWEYDNTVFEGNVTDGDFTYAAKGDDKTITCKITGCKTN